MSYSVIRLYPAAEKSAHFAPIFDDLACSYKNEGSIPFTRSIFLLSKFAVSQATVIRVSYDIVRISPVSLGFQPRNRNRGSGADDSTDGLALSLIPCRKNMVPHALTGGEVKWRRPSCTGGGERPFPRFLGFTVAVAAKRAVVPPAYLGMEASLVGGPGMGTIWWRAFGTDRENRGRWGRCPLPR